MITLVQHGKEEIGKKARQVRGKHKKGVGGGGGGGGGGVIAASRAANCGDLLRSGCE
jgi:hypothetical protein